MGFGVRGSGFRVCGDAVSRQGQENMLWGFGFRVWGLGFRVECSGFGVERLGFRV